MGEALTKRLRASGVVFEVLEGEEKHPGRLPLRVARWLLQPPP